MRQSSRSECTACFVDETASAVLATNHKGRRYSTTIFYDVKFKRHFRKRDIYAEHAMCMMRSVYTPAPLIDYPGAVGPPPPEVDARCISRGSLLKWRRPSPPAFRPAFILADTAQTTRALRTRVIATENAANAIPSKPPSTDDSLPSAPSGVAEWRSAIKFSYAKQ